MPSDRDRARRDAEALEDAAGAVAGRAAYVAISFKHTGMRSMVDPETREEVADLADKVRDLYALLDAHGYYDRPHEREQRRAVVVLGPDGIDDAAAYIGEGVGAEHAFRFDGDDGGAGLSPVEYAVLARIVPFMGDHREQAARLVEDPR